MKKLFLAVIFLAFGLIVLGQSQTIDTLRLKRGGKLFELITYGNNDSISINKIRYYTAPTPAPVTYVSRYSAYSSGGNNVEVLAWGTGITVTVANTNEITFAIPAGTRLISAKIRFANVSSLKLFVGVNDMGNTTANNRWMTIAHAWREDTGQQLMAVGVLMDIYGVYDKITINGLINTVTCQTIVSF